MTHKYKVGDKVRVVRDLYPDGESRVGWIGIVEYVYPVTNSVNIRCNDGKNGYFLNQEVEPSNANTLTLNTSYTAMNGTNWTCIHVRENGNAVLDNGISSAEYTSEGWRVDGDSRYDVRWEDEVEEVTWRCSRSGKGLPQYNTLFDVTLNLINGQPDWSSAKVEGV